MKTKVFVKNKNGKIELAEEELKKILDEVYEDGYNDCRSRIYYYTPYYPPYYRDYWTTITYNDCTASSTATLSNTETETYKWVPYSPE